MSTPPPSEIVRLTRIGLIIAAYLSGLTLICVTVLVMLGRADASMLMIVLSTLVTPVVLAIVTVQQTLMHQDVRDIKITTHDQVSDLLHKIPDVPPSPDAPTPPTTPQGQSTMDTINP